jgi:hypothetical protein
MHSKPAYDITQDLGTPGCWFHKRGSTCCNVTEIQKVQVLLASCIKGLPKTQKSILQDCVHYSKHHAAYVLSWPSSGHRNVAGRNESRRGCSTLSVSPKHHFSTGEKTERAKWCNWPTKIGTSTRNYGTPRSLDSSDAAKESTSRSSWHCRGDTW